MRSCLSGFGDVLKGVTGIANQEEHSARPQCQAILGQTAIPFGKLQEGYHFLRGVDLGQRVVWVHQYNCSDDQPLKKKRPVS